VPTRTNGMKNSRPRARIRTKTRNSPRMTKMAIPSTATLQKVGKHTNATFLSLARKSIGVATPNANVGGATEPSCMPNGSKSSRPNAKREKMGKTTRKQMTNKAPHHFFRFHVPTMLAPLEMVSQALFKGIHP